MVMAAKCEKFNIRVKEFSLIKQLVYNSCTIRSLHTGRLVNTGGGYVRCALSK